MHQGHICLLHKAFAHSVPFGYLMMMVCPLCFCTAQCGKWDDDDDDDEFSYMDLN